MTETTKTIFAEHEIRKSKKQKAAFLSYVQEQAKSWGYHCHVEKGSFGAQNLVVGDPAGAKVIYTAHYDTCAVLPFSNLITPKRIGLYLLYQIGIVVLFMVLPMLLLAVVTGALTAIAGVEEDLALLLVGIVSYGFLLFFCWWVMAGPANRHTANDNTSGVTVLLDSMQTMPVENRGDVAYIFFDLEEMGLFGSSGYYSRHKKEMQYRLLINFDCVSDGETILLAPQRRAKSYLPKLREAFPTTEACTVDIPTRGVFYPSDQVAFPCGVGVAAMRKTNVGGILYMDKIHTAKDVVYREENIAYLAECTVRLAQGFHTK